MRVGRADTRGCEALGRSEMAVLSVQRRMVDVPGPVSRGPVLCFDPDGKRGRGCLFIRRAPSGRRDPWDYALLRIWPGWRWEQRAWRWEFPATDDAHAALKDTYGASLRYDCSFLLWSTAEVQE